MSAGFVLNGKAVLPLAKPQAFYAFTGLAPATYALEIATREFFPYQTSLPVPMALPLAQGIVVCTLEPGPLYPFEPWDTLVCGRITRKRAPQGGVRIEASYTGQSRRTVSRQTRSWADGTYHGRYALALGSRLAAATDIALDFVAPDGARGRRVVRITPGTTAIADMDID